MSDRVSDETLRRYASAGRDDDALRWVARELLDARARIAELERVASVRLVSLDRIVARLALAEEVIEAARLVYTTAPAILSGVHSMHQEALADALDRYDAARKETA